jgi:hypothetical protein
MATDTIARGLALGAVRVASRHVFTSEMDRTVYFSNNPDELKEGTYIFCVNQLQRYENGQWIDRSSAIKGEKGDTGTSITSVTDNGTKFTVNLSDGSKFDINKATNLASLTTINTTNFNKNLDNTITDVQKLADFVDDGLNTTIEVYADGTLVSKDVKKLNFTGINITAVEVDGGTRIDVISPKPQYVSHFNTSDGTNNATISQITGVTRTIATGSGIKIGDWSPNSIKQCINNPNVSVSTSGNFLCDDSTTTLIVNIYDDAKTIIRTATFNLNANTILTTNGITVNVSNWSNNGVKYQCLVNVSFNVQTVLGSDATRFSFDITHKNKDKDYVFTQSDLFYDGGLQSNIGTITLSNQVPVIRKVSGVSYLNVGSTFGIDVQNIANTNNYTYIDSDGLIVNSSADLGLTGFNIPLSGLTNWTNGKDSVSSYTKNNWQLTEVNKFIGYENYANHTVSASIGDWTRSSNKSSNPLGVLINTLTTKAYEDFVDDNVSTSLIGTGKLMMYNSCLCYPRGNFTNLYPNDGLLDLNYDNIVGQCSYSKVFSTTGTKSNGQFKLIGFSNLTESDFASGLVKILLNDGTYTYDMTKNYLGNKLVNGSGIRTSPDTNNLSTNGILSFTLGLKYVSSCTITIIFTSEIARTNNIKIDGISIIDW